MLRDQFGLCLHRLGEPLLQHLRNPLMILLPGTFQQGGVGRILNEGMLKGIGDLWWHPALVDNFCLDQPAATHAVR